MGSVCLARGDTILSAAPLETQSSHSAHLLNTIEQTLTNANCALDEVDVFAAASGPGSFTGVRIGLATLKAFAATIGRPCVGVPTLEAIAHAAGPSDRTVVLLPAGRGELFTQMFSVGAAGEIDALNEAAYLKPEDACRKYADFSSVRWAGEGAVAHAAALSDQALAHQYVWLDNANGENSEDGAWMVVPPRPLAVSIAAIALLEFQRGKTVSAEELHAIYVRPSDAELNQKWPTPKQPSR
ncbi:MAG: tRNA threonylcarbamoyladenosine biosynthesis protein TsaB [Blastocatellia bacterium]|nr:tRNA threonylcarbamoyladenosine biosynthesis protein TsaB [Blastocatellia bacterium]